MAPEAAKRPLRRNEHHRPAGHEQQLFGKGVSGLCSNGRRVLTHDAEVGKARVLRHNSRSNTIEAAPFDLETVLPLNVLQRRPQSLCCAINCFANRTVRASDRLGGALPKLCDTLLVALGRVQLSRVESCQPTLMAARQIC